jgi:four helix bundle protein
MIGDRGLGIAEREDKSARVADAVMSTNGFCKRTFQLGIRLVRLVQAPPKTEVARVIGNQLLRAGTAVDANYRAAALARARADVIAKMGIVEEECDEAPYWLEMLVELQLVDESRLKDLGREANEMLSIVVASIRTARGNAKGAVRY